MLAVPEVDDDLVDSPPDQGATELPSTTNDTINNTAELSPTTENNIDEAAAAAMKNSTSPNISQQNRSRLSQFQRNTIHVCERNGNSSVSHQEHHSAPPNHHQTPRPGLDSINENVEDPPDSNQNEESTVTNNRFPRSSTVPYPAYATLRKSTVNSGYFSPPHYYYADYPPSFIHEPSSPDPSNAYLLAGPTYTSINGNFQPISPQHQQYGNRPVDILKPTFLIVPKAVEQKLAVQLSASNSPILPTAHKSRAIVQRSHSKPETRSTRTFPASPRTTVRNVEVQTNGEDSTRALTTATKTPELTYRNIGLLPTANPSPYVYFGSCQTSPPTKSIVQEDSKTITTNNQSTSIHPLEQESSHQAQDSPSSRHYHSSQLVSNDQHLNLLTNLQSFNPRPISEIANHTEPLKIMNSQTRDENDQYSIGSLDLAQIDLVDVPGSWRYRSVPTRNGPRRQRAPLPHSFFDSQQYASDSEQIIQQPSIYRQQTFFGSIPTIHGPFDSIRSHVPIQIFPSIRLTESDILKISAFYRSMGTLVFVARSSATLYSSDFDAMANLKDWKKLYTGVPVWLFNTGMNPKRTRCIRLIIAELGSSFTLWDTIVNGASDVRLPKARHITLKSLETGTILALKFDDAMSTDEFHQHFVKLSSNPRNADLFDVFNPKRQRPQFYLRKRKIKKSAISKPSKFNHINKVDENDRESLYTFSVLVDDAIATH